MIIATMIENTPEIMGDLAAVRHVLAPITVICRWSNDNGSWTPLFGLNDDSKRIELPACFKPTDEMLDALDELRSER